MFIQNKTYAFYALVISCLIFVAGCSSAPSGPTPAGTSSTAAPTEFRALDGSGNNVANPGWGQAGSNLLIDTSLDYSDGISAPAGAERPSSRAISNAVHAQSKSFPSASEVTALFVSWGQLLAHDLSLTPTGMSDALQIHGDDADLPDTALPFVSEPIEPPAPVTSTRRPVT